MTVGDAVPPAGDHVLVPSCPDRPGIVNRVAALLVDHGGNILESQQSGELDTSRPSSAVPRHSQSRVLLDASRTVVFR